jgi:hypothetical protein
MIATITRRAAEASPVWGAQAAPAAEHPPGPGTRVAEPFALGVETIREGYLVHHGASRAFRPATSEQAILLGDYLYAAGLVEICAAGDLDAVRTLASLIADVSDRRARGVPDDPARWDAAVEALS